MEPETSSYRYLVSCLLHELQQEFARKIEHCTVDDAIKIVIEAIFKENKKKYLHNHSSADVCVSEFKSKFRVFISKRNNPEQVLYELAMFFIWDSKARQMDIPKFMSIANPKMKRKKTLELPQTKGKGKKRDEIRKQATQGKMFAPGGGQWY